MLGGGVGGGVGWERVQETWNAYLQVMVHLNMCSRGQSQMEQDGNDYHAWS